MMDVESSYSDFITCDRTGRRNAVPDIKGEGAVVGTGELTKDMAQMALKKGGRSASDKCLLCVCTCMYVCM
uniref:cAMP-dependent protein kinase inhibitor gamma n=1 Tax=Electrophorus electricus TaxID=8005 RepID=A0A4W4HPZ7_ELEEL